MCIKMDDFGSSRRGVPACASTRGWLAASDGPKGLFPARLPCLRPAVDRGRHPSPVCFARLCEGTAWRKCPTAQRLLESRYIKNIALFSDIYKDDRFGITFALGEYAGPCEPGTRRLFGRRLKTLQAIRWIGHRMPAGRQQRSQKEV